MVSLKPMIEFNGVRSSWLMRAKKSDFTRLAVSARSFSAMTSATNELLVQRKVNI